MKNLEAGTGGLPHKVRNRVRTVRKRVVSIAIASRVKGAPGVQKHAEHYRELLTVSPRIVNDAQRVLNERKRRRWAEVKNLRDQFESVASQVKQVISEAKARVFEGTTKVPERIVSL